MATHSSILAWRIPGTEEPGGLLSMGLHRVRHDWSDLAAAAGISLWDSTQTASSLWWVPSQLLSARGWVSAWSLTGGEKFCTSSLAGTQNMQLPKAVNTVKRVTSQLASLSSSGQLMNLINGQRSESDVFGAENWPQGLSNSPFVEKTTSSYRKCSKLIHSEPGVSVPEGSLYKRNAGRRILRPRLDLPTPP